MSGPVVLLLPVEPIGVHKVLAYSGGRCRRVDAATYPPSPEGARLRKRRSELGLSPEKAAQRIGIVVGELYRLEIGALVASHWSSVFDLLELAP